MSKHSDKWYIEQAITQWHCDGEIEIDDGAVVSAGEDPGAYVQAWVWVYDSAGPDADPWLDEEETP